MPHGKLRYVIPSLWDELDNIRREEGLQRFSEAQNKLVQYSILGREAKRLRDRMLLADVFKRK